MCSCNVHWPRCGPVGPHGQGRGYFERATVISVGSPSNGQRSTVNGQRPGCRVLDGRCIICICNSFRRSEREADAYGRGPMTDAHYLESWTLEAGGGCLRHRLCTRLQSVAVCRLLDDIGCRHIMTYSHGDTDEASLCPRARPPELEKQCATDENRRFSESKRSRYVRGSSQDTLVQN